MSRIAWLAAVLSPLPVPRPGDAGRARARCEHLPWLLVASRDERSLKEVVPALREQSRTAELLELGRTEHASDILAAHLDLAGRIAVWYRHRLVAPSAPWLAARRAARRPVPLRGRPV